MIRRSQTALGDPLVAATHMSAGQVDAGDVATRKPHRQGDDIAARRAVVLEHRGAIDGGRLSGPITF